MTLFRYLSYSLCSFPTDKLNQNVRPILNSYFLKLFNFISAAPYDEIAYQIRQSRGLPQPWQAEEKFGKKEDLQPQPDQVAAEAVVVDPSESVETSLLGFVTHVELTERVTY